MTLLRRPSNIRVCLYDPIGNMLDLDEDFMREALIEAEAACKDGEVPVGAIIVLEGRVIARGRNGMIGANDPTAHAEIVALRNAASTIGNYRLTGSTMYSTIEPCAMCAGALVHARVERLVFGANDPKAGAVETHFGICNAEFLNHQVSVEGGILEGECRRVLQSFFRDRRNTQSNAERCESG